MACLNQMSIQELRDKYIKVNEEFVTLKRYTRKQEDKITKLQTKLQKLIADYNRGKSKNFNIGNFELEEKNESLQLLVSQLQMKNRNLEAKLQVANVRISTLNQRRLYGNISSRINTGLKNGPRRTKSLINIAGYHKSLASRPNSAIKIGSSRNSFVEEPNVSSPTHSIKTPEMVTLPNDVKFVMEEARKKILELEDELEQMEEEHKQLLQQLADTQQNNESIELELKERIVYLEKELEREKEISRDKDMKGERELSTYIRSERECRSASAKVTALTEHMNVLETKLSSEKRHKEQLLEEVESFKLSKKELENQLKEFQLKKDKLVENNNELKETNSYLKRQIKQLESDNDRITKLMTSSGNESKGKSQDTNFIEHLQKEINLLQDMIKNERDDKAALNGELAKLRENLIEKETQLKHLNSSYLDVQTKLNKITKNGVYDYADIETLIDSCKRTAQKKEKITTFEKPSFKELEKKFNELQWLYREKKLELDKQKNLLSGHSETYRHILENKEQLTKEYSLKEQKLNEKINELETSLKFKEDTCYRLQEEILKKNNSKEYKNGKLDSSSSHLFQALSFSKHYNILEFFLEKIVFSIENFEPSVKSFISWVMPFDLSDPLQHTNLALGPEANYKFNTLYKFKMNFHNFMRIKEGDVLLNIFILLNDGNPLKIGESRLFLNELLSHPKNVLHGTVRVKVATEDYIPLTDISSDISKVMQSISLMGRDSDIGYLHYSIRLHKSSEAEIAQFMKASAQVYKEDTVPSDASKSLKSIQKQSSMSDISTETTLSRGHKINETIPSTVGKARESRPFQKGNTQLNGRSHSYTTLKIDSSKAFTKDELNLFKEVKSGTYSTKASFEDETSSSKDSVKVRHCPTKAEDETHMSKLTQEKSSKFVETKKIGISDTKKIKLMRTFSSSNLASTSTAVSSKEESISLNGEYLTKTKDKKLIKSKKSNSSQNTNNGSRPKEVQESIKTLTRNVSNEDNVREDTKNGVKKEVKNKQEKVDETKEKPRRLSQQLLKAFRRPSLIRSKGGNLDENEKKLGKKSKLGRFFKNKNVSLEKRKPIEEKSIESDEEEDTYFEEEENTISSSTPLSEDDEDIDEESTSRNIIYKKDELEDTLSGEHTYDSGKKLMKLSTSNDDYSDNDNESISEHHSDEKRMGNDKVPINSSGEQEEVDEEVTDSQITRESADESTTDEKTEIKSEINGYIYIEIISVKLNKKNRIIKDPLIKYLFIDYHGFLNLEPSQLETPESLPKALPGKMMNFNFKNMIEINEKKFGQRCAAFRNFMKGEGLVKFTLLSEPPKELQEKEDCKELGYCFVNVKNLIEQKITSKKQYDIMDIETEESVGILSLKISTSGLT